MKQSKRDQTKRRQFVPLPVVPVVRNVEREFDQLITRIGRDLEDLVESGRAARQDMVEKIKGDMPGTLADRVSWAEGVKDDLLALSAAKTLQAMENYRELSMIEILAYCINDCARTARWTSAGSSSAFANAVSLEKIQVAYDFWQKLTGWRDRLVELRAELEVL